MKFAGVITLSVEDGLPTEFRLFKKGWNETENGRFLFDDVAAKSVMSSYAKWGVDLAIDLEHQMLEVEAGAADPDARDARGWCKLELRNGELWACDVKWTADGEKRLTNKTQRYVSPAFDADPQTKRVLKMINVAITAMPATHKTPALVAASARKGGSMDPNLVKQALEAIEKGDAKSALDILKGLVASAAGAEPDGDGDDDGSEGDGAEGVAPPAEAESVEDPKVVDASAAPPPDGKDGDGSDDDDDEDDDKKKAQRKAMRALLRKLTDTKSFAEALAIVEVFRTSHLTLETERKKLAAERATLESAERRRHVVELVQLGAEFPATVWVDPLAKDKAIKPRWLKMPIAELRSHVAEQRKARGAKPPTAFKPASDPASKDAGAVPPEVAALGLDAREYAICLSTKCDPAVFASLKATRDGKKG